jgi:pyruvate,water dikinase
MNLWLTPQDISPEDRSRIGGKAWALAQLAAHGLRIPRTLCLTTEAYRAFVEETGLEEKIMLELHRKALEDMRWEEMWDGALRIRNLFLRTSLPRSLSDALNEGLGREFQGGPVAVRSSALGEDEEAASFAGIHDSFLDLTGEEEILKHIKLVWASLWSDAALLYRHELGLDEKDPAMAVVVQEFIRGDISGVVFGQNPMDPGQSVVEAVSGLNQGLVDGTVEPERWILNRKTRDVIDVQPPHTPLPEASAGRAAGAGPKRESLIAQDLLPGVLNLADRAERIFGRPQDVEWTYLPPRLYALQSRAITALESEPAPGTKAWHLTLRRSFENLKALRRTIEEHTIPEMLSASESLADIEIEDLDDRNLAGEILRRSRLFKTWRDVYWETFIPFAHGIRLFGQVYNERVQPEDPFAFVEILRPERMESLDRNRLLAELSEGLRGRPDMRRHLENGEWAAVPASFKDSWDRFHRDYANLRISDPQEVEYRRRFIAFLEKIGKPYPPSGARGLRNRESRERGFLAGFPSEERDKARELLDLARFSYRLRDDDNIYLGRIEEQLHRALREFRKRMVRQRRIVPAQVSPEDAARMLQDSGYRPKAKEKAAAGEPDPNLQPRQIKGQPAGKGLASGRARVIRDASDLFSFERGEILVCDAIEPNMTFVVPLAGAIVERRGGMLIHGAIIAREYGIPCVTGIPDITRLVRTGDRITVDGFLGLVIFDEI